MAPAGDEIGVSEARSQTARRGLMRPAITAVGLCRPMILAGVWAALPCAALGQAAARCPILQGPQIVHPRGLVVFKQHGFKPRAPVQVAVGPLQFGDASARTTIIHKAFRTDAVGRIRLRFRWPANGSLCSGTGECRAVPWSNGEHAYVHALVGNDLSDAPSTCAYKQVTIRLALRAMGRLIQPR